MASNKVLEEGTAICQRDRNEEAAFSKGDMADI